MPTLARASGLNGRPPPDYHQRVMLRFLAVRVGPPLVVVVVGVLALQPAVRRVREAASRSADL